jgi:thiamine biosynthesis lipoprotein
MTELGFEFGAMACPCELRLCGPDEAALRAAASAAIAEVQRIEAKYSRYRGDGVVALVNRRAGSGLITEVDGETAALLDFAARLFAQSGGRFDISSGVLRRAWDFGRAQLPAQQQIDALLPLVGWARVHWQRPRLLLPLPGMEIDFGGFGKEYAADRAVAVLAARGIAHGFVNLGGDIALVGPRPGGAPWRFGIRHPRDGDRMLSQVALQRGGLATSGDYERFIEVDGLRYCHLLDPRTGWPVRAWQAISVVGPTCAAAGAVCTVAMLMAEAAPAFLDAQGLPYLAAAADGTLVDRLS